MKLPTKADCESLYKQYRLPGNVRRHTELVTKIAIFTAAALRKAGLPINTGLVEAAAKLHDLARPVDFSSFLGKDGKEVMEWEQLRKHPGNHAQVAYEILKLDYPEVAEIVRKHFYRAVVTPGLKPATWEEKIVSYADKRVSHDKIVTLQQRFKEGASRWQKNHPEAIRDQDEEQRIYAIYYSIEREIFKRLGPALQKILENGTGLL